jgi:hypothetical protein
VTLKESAAGEIISASGDEELNHGKTTAMDLSLNIPSVGSMREILLDGKIYLRLPDGFAGPKPWAEVGPNSTDPALQQLFSSLQSVSQTGSGSFAQVALFLQVATNLQYEGTGPVNGTTAGHYKLSIDVTKLPASFPDKSTLIQAGVTSIPIDLWADAQGRLVQMVEDITVQGQQVNVTVGLGNFDAPVHITAPPPGQVSH